VAVEAGQAPLTLCVRWSDGGESLIDVSGPVGVFRVYAPLRDASERFAEVRGGEYCADIVWNDEIGMAAESLWRLAKA